MCEDDNNKKPGIQLTKEITKLLNKDDAINALGLLSNGKKLKRTTELFQKIETACGVVEGS
ncbi:MAG: hypothetical protein N3A64_04800 [Desulfobacterota bacterium]|nr:hypothetical protein [Thermodesulfobacteriota bacterium]